MTSDVQKDAPPIVQDANMGYFNGPSMPSSTDSAQDSSQFRTFLASGGYSAGNAEAQHSERANAFRGAQLQDLLKAARNVEAINAVIVYFAFATEQFQRE